MRPPAILRLESLDGGSFVDARFAHVQLRDGRVILLGVRDRGPQDRLVVPRGPLLLELERGDRLVHPQPADHVRDEPRLPRGDACEAMGCLVSHGS